MSSNESLPTVTVVDRVSHTGRVSPAQLEAWMVGHGFRRVEALPDDRWIWLTHDVNKDTIGVPRGVNFRDWPEMMTRSIQELAHSLNIQPSQVLREAAAIEVSEAP